MNLNVAIIGASDKEERYSYKAMKMLKDHGHNPLLVHPSLKEVEGVKVFSSLVSIEQEIDTITIYISPKLQTGLLDNIIQSDARRVIFNPGTENSELESKLSSKNIECLNACTLVMLSTNQF